MVNINNKIKFIGRVLYLFLRKKIIKPEEIIRDYDRLSSDYDEYFSRFMKKHSLIMVHRLNITPSLRVLDLASGTGTIALEAAGLANNGEIVAIDRSEGMLNQAKQKADSLGYRNITFIRGDIIEEVKKLPENNFDVVACGWAISYFNPPALFKEIHRVLKPSGIVGIIENKQDTLAEIRKTSIKVAQEYPSKIQYIMDLHLRLPKGNEHLSGLFKMAKLIPIATWEDKEQFEFVNGKEVLNWVLHTGASAGFDRMMASDIKKECDELFIHFIERDYLKDGKIAVAHRYVAGIAKAEK